MREKVQVAIISLTPCVVREPSCVTVAGDKMQRSNSFPELQLPAFDEASCHFLAYDGKYHQSHIPCWLHRQRAGNRAVMHRLVCEYGSICVRAYTPCVFLEYVRGASSMHSRGRESTCWQHVNMHMRRAPRRGTAAVN